MKCVEDIMKNKIKKIYSLIILGLLCITTVIQAEPVQVVKSVYLTFDDGPTKEVTEAILDALKEKNVKATFFVVGKEIPQREAVLKRIYEEGHAIGLHSYSHNFKKVYATTESFIEEMEETEAKINEVLGTQLDINIIRFPGGSAGRLSEPMLEQLHNKGYKIYDWNINLEDGVKPNLAPSQLVENAKKITRDSDQLIILGHCNSNNRTTAEAIAGIIDYYQKRGYTFKPIDQSTTEFYYRIRTKK